VEELEGAAPIHLFRAEAVQALGCRRVVEEAALGIEEGEDIPGVGQEGLQAVVAQAGRRGICH